MEIRVTPTTGCAIDPDVGGSNLKVLILANGEPPSGELARRLAARHDMLIATDGAAQRAVTLGVTPDIVCGDFDSVDLAVVRREFPCAEIVPTPDQNSADLEKALLLARTRGATAVTIAGAAGGRIDHLFANFALLLRYQHELKLCVVDDHSQVWPVSGTFEFAAQSGDTVSLIAWESGVCVSISGVQWGLREAALLPGTLGVSNRAIGGQVRVEVHQGNILLCHLYSSDGGQRPTSDES
jgi:thiamine pyrophosphokinase